MTNVVGAPPSNARPPAEPICGLLRPDLAGSQGVVRERCRSLSSRSERAHGRREKAASMNCTSPWSVCMWSTNESGTASNLFASRHNVSSLFPVHSMGCGATSHPASCVPSCLVIEPRTLLWHTSQFACNSARSVMVRISFRGFFGNYTANSQPGCFFDFISSPPWQLMQRGWRKTGIISRNALTASICCPTGRGQGRTADRRQESRRHRRRRREPGTLPGRREAQIGQPARGEREREGDQPMASVPGCHEGSPAQRVSY